MATPSNTFCYPIKTLENSRLRLEPFEPNVHAQPFWEGSRQHPEFWDHLSFGPFPSADSFVEGFILKRIVPNDANFLYAVIAKAGSRDAQAEDEVAGIIGFLDTNVESASTEIAFVMILPEFQRTFVASNAVGLMLIYCLDPPSQGGLGLRRVQYQTNSRNGGSQRLAKRLLMTFEGITRWHRTLDYAKVGNGEDVTVLSERNGRGDERPGRHSAVLSMCWDDWIEKKEDVLKVMDRQK